MTEAASKIREKIFFADTLCFEEIALELFRFQYQYNPVYRQFVQLQHSNPEKITSVCKIPFLPVEFFKTHSILVENAPVEKIFESSGTTGQQTSKHAIADLSIYLESFTRSFNLFYGDPGEWIITALLPSYVERNNSSLVFMVNELMRLSRNERSGFYLNENDRLIDTLKSLNKENKNVLLIGVTFALLELAEKHEADLGNITIMETGGMKGRREEMTREEVHRILASRFNVKTIYSEYGMTEMLSQAYSKGNGIFQSPPRLKILKRDVYDPLNVTDTEGRGALNIIDLANIYSCAFIAAQDVVNITKDGFEITGRIDNSDIRGCNLMVAG